MADTNGSAAAIAKKPDPSKIPASFLQGNDRMQLGVRNGNGSIDWVLPNFGKYPVSHISSFQSLMTSQARVYRQYDEAIKASLDNARYMRNDCGIWECIEARQRCVALLNWHLEPEDDKSEEQKSLCTELTKILKRIRRFTEYRRVLLEAVWFGKYAIQHQYGWENIGGQMRILPKGRHEGDIGWLPVNGDKLCFRFNDGNLSGGQYDGQVGIRVGIGHAVGSLVNENKRWKVESTDRGLAYFIDEDERRLLAIHKHTIEDGAYEDALSAGMIHGVGIRSRIYWEWVQKQETLGFLMEYLERSAGGMEMWRYPSGNPEAKQQVEKAATEHVGFARNVILVPVPAGDDSGQYGVEIVEPGMAGIEAVKDLLVNYFGHRIKRVYLGQTLTSEAEATGLGSGVADAHMDTLNQIVKYDATNLEETITFEQLRWIKEWNFPAARNIHVRFVIDTEDTDAKDTLEMYERAQQMGAKIPAKNVHDLIGCAMPGPDVEILEPQQQSSGGMFPGMNLPGQPGKGPDGKGDQDDGGDDFGDDFPDPAGGDSSAAETSKSDGEPERYSAFNESDHPRAPAGSAEGGEFLDRMHEAHQQHRQRVHNSISFEVGRQLSESSKPNAEFKKSLQESVKSPDLAGQITDAGYEYPSGNAVKSFVHDALKEHWSDLGGVTFKDKTKPGKIGENARFDQVMKEHKVGWQKQVAVETQREVNRQLAKLGIPKDFGMGIGPEVAKEAAAGGAHDINDLMEEKLQTVVDEWNEQLPDDAEPVRYAKKPARSQGDLFADRGQKKINWREEDHPRNNDGEFVESSSGDVRSTLHAELSSGKHMTLREMQELVGQGAHHPEDPLSHPVNAALAAMRDAGDVSVHEPRQGEPSFWMTDEQIEKSKGQIPESGPKLESEPDADQTAQETEAAAEENPEPEAATNADAETAGDSGGDQGDAAGTGVETKPETKLQDLPSDSENKHELEEKDGNLYVPAKGLASYRNFLPHAAEINAKFTGTHWRMPVEHKRKVIAILSGDIRDRHQTIAESLGYTPVGPSVQLTHKMGMMSKDDAMRKSQSRLAGSVLVIDGRKHVVTDSKKPIYTSRDNASSGNGPHPDAGWNIDYHAVPINENPKIAAETLRAEKYSRAASSKSIAARFDRAIASVRSDLAASPPSAEFPSPIE